MQLQPIQSFGTVVRHAAQRFVRACVLYCAQMQIVKVGPVHFFRFPSCVAVAPRPVSFQRTLLLTLLCTSGFIHLCQHGDIVSPEIPITKSGPVTQNEI